MKISFYTKNIDAPCSSFYYSGLREICDFKSELIELESYSIVMVMTYDHLEIKQIRINYPNIKIGIIDPRDNSVYESVKFCDFIIVDSIEMEDFWRKAKKLIFRYVEYPNISPMFKDHKNADKVIIGYHGNRVHLQSMEKNITPVLSNLGKEFNIEMILMYNGQPPKGNESWLPKNINIKHVKWSFENYFKKLSIVDIGIVPNGIMSKNKLYEILCEKDDILNLSSDDYVLRFKMPSNPGRIIVFGLLGIPVVSDFFPSGILHLQDGRGLIAHNKGGWEYSLKKLILSYSLRQSMGKKLQDYVLENYDYKTQNKKLLTFLHKSILSS